jgi:DNA helicase HerA-like ATPase
MEIRRGATRPPVRPFLDQSDADRTGPSVTGFDLSLVATDVLENVTSLLGRILFEFAAILAASHPMLLVLEEAHRFVPSAPQTTGARSVAVFERIAKEGRKFGISLLLASQRPSELSETVVAQCGTVIAHRLTHEADQALLRHATPFGSHGLLSQLPGLVPQHALVTGVSSAVPAAVRIRDVEDPPRSQDPDFIARVGRNPG